MAYGRGLFGGGGLVENEQQRRERERLEAMFPEAAGRQAPSMSIGIDVGVPAAKQPRQSFWQGGEKFTGRDALAGVLAAVGDAFAQRGGMQPAAVQGLAGGRLSALQMAKEAQAAQLARQQGLQDYEAKQQIDQKYATPQVNDTERDYEFMVRTVGKDVADGWLRNRGDPPITMTLPNGQVFSGPRSALPQALGGGQSAPPSAPVGKLTPLGGATAPASPPFPVPRRYR